MANVAKLHSVTARILINEQSTFLEVTRQEDGTYLVAIVDFGRVVHPHHKAEETPQIYLERDIYRKITFQQKPSASDINKWMQEERWFTFHNAAKTVETVLEALP